MSQTVLMLASRLDSAAKQTHAVLVTGGKAVSTRGAGWNPRPLPQMKKGRPQLPPAFSVVSADSADTPAGVVHPASFPNCNAKTRSSWVVGWLPFLDIHCFFQSFALESPNKCARAGLAQPGRLRRTTRRRRRLWWRTVRRVTRQRSAAHP